MGFVILIIAFSIILDKIYDYANEKYKHIDEYRRGFLTQETFEEICAKIFTPFVIVILLVLIFNPTTFAYVLLNLSYPLAPYISFEQIEKSHNTMVENNKIKCTSIAGKVVDIQNYVVAISDVENGLTLGLQSKLKSTRKIVVEFNGGHREAIEDETHLIGENFTKTECKIGN